MAATTRTSVADRLRLAYRVHLARLEEAQQLGLHVQSHVADFVEEQRASRRRADQPGRFSIAPVNAPRLWPNSCESSISRGMDAQLKGMNGPLARVDAA